MSFFFSFWKMLWLSTLWLKWMNHQKTESPEKTQIDLGPGRRVFCAFSQGMAEDGKFWKFFSSEKHPKSSRSCWILKDQDALATLSSPPFWDGEWVNTWPEIRLVIHDQPNDLGNQKRSRIELAGAGIQLVGRISLLVSRSMDLLQEAKRTRRSWSQKFHRGCHGCQASLICLVSCWEAQNGWEEVLLDKSC